MSASSSRPLTTMPDVIVVDVRADRRLLSEIGGIKRRYPSMGVAIVVPSLEPDLMLEAMRAGVSECISEPLTREAVETAITRVMVQRTAPLEGRVFAIVGAKGGVGATTVAVNVADAIAQALGDALLIDLHVAAGEAAVFLGVEPRFSVAEALEIALHDRSPIIVTGSLFTVADAREAWFRRIGIEIDKDC